MVNVPCNVDQEMIDEAVNIYLEKKKITQYNIVKNGTYKLTQTPSQMLESSILEHQTSQNNTYIYSCNNQNVTQMDTEFVKLKNWIHELSNAKCKQELSQLLFPIFCHLYLDAISDGNVQQVQSAVIFFKRHQSSFTCESLKDIMKDVGNIFKKEEIEVKPLVKVFRSAKCEICLSSQSASLLRNFISVSDEPTILLNVLNSWFILEDSDHNPREDDDPAVCPEAEIMMGQKVESLSSPEKMLYENNDTSDSEIDENGDENQDNFFKNEFQSLVTTFKNLRNSTPQPSPLLLLQMHNAQNISCGSVCYPSKQLVVGQLNSDVKIFSFSEEESHLPEGKSLPVKINVPNYSDTQHYNTDNSGNHFSVLRGHSGPISAVRVLQNPDVVLSASEDRTWKAWRREDFSCASVYRGHISPIWGLDVSSLNLYVVTGSQDKTARLWTLDKTYPLRLYVGHYGSVTCVKFHPNGVYLGTGSTDKTVRLFSVIDGKTARLFTGHTGPVYCLCFSPNGQYLASGGDCNEVIVWNLSLGQQYITVDTSSKIVCDLSWNSDSSVLAITFLKQYIYLLHVPKTLKNNTQEIIGKYNLPENRFVSCQYGVKNNLIAVAVV